MVHGHLVFHCVDLSDFTQPFAGYRNQKREQSQAVSGSSRVFTIRHSANAQIGEAKDLKTSQIPVIHLCQFLSHCNDSNYINRSNVNCFFFFMSFFIINYLDNFLKSGVYFFFFV